MSTFLSAIIASFCLVCSSCAIYTIGFVLFGQSRFRRGRIVTDHLSVAAMICGLIGLVASFIWIVFEGYSGVSVF